MRRTLSGLMAAFLLLAASAEAAPKPSGPCNGETSSDGKVLWCPDHFEGWKDVMIVRRPDGTIHIQIAPELIYQQFRLVGVTHNGIPAGVQFWELRANRIKGEDGEKHTGWKNPVNIFRYPLHLFDAAASRSIVQVLSDGNKGLLIVVYSITVAPQAPRPRAPETKKADAGTIR